MDIVYDYENNVQSLNWKFTKIQIYVYIIKYKIHIWETKISEEFSTSIKKNE